MGILAARREAKKELKLQVVGIIQLLRLKKRKNGY